MGRLELLPLLLLLLLLTSGGIPPTAAQVQVIEVGSLIRTALGMEEFVAQAWADTNSTTAALLLARFQQVAERLSPLESSVAAVRRNLRNIENNAPTEVRWQLTVETLENLLRPITSNYERFLFYQRHNGSVERHTLEDFAVHAVSHDPHSLQPSMASLHHLAKGLGMPSLNPHSRQQRYAFKQGLFLQLKKVLESSKKMICQLTQSPQQLAYGLHGILVLALAEGYVMIQFSYMLLKLYDKGDFTMEAQLASDTYGRISFDVASAAQSIIKDLSNEFWRCDPAQHASGDTYEQVTELLQGYMENEVDLNGDGTCNNNCAYYGHARRHGCYMKRDFMICGHQRPCNGRVHECRFFNADSTVCFADGSDGAHRRYNWIEFENGKQLGRLGSCSHARKVDSWWRNLFWHCSYCFCLCDDDTSSDRYFSLQPVVADLAENKVVTGVRFVKKNRVFYIQIEQGTADLFGLVNASSVEWKPIKKPIDIKRDIADRDFFKLSWERRSVDLDDLRAPDGHVVTGVTFRKLGEHLNLEIQVAPIVAHTAKLSGSRAYWLSNDNTPASKHAPRRKLSLGHDPDVPTRSRAASWPDSSSDMYVQLGASSARLDASQTTLPFLDTQPVAPRPAVWLTGLGLFHKGRPGSGGYLALRVHTVDLTSRVAVDLESGGSLTEDGTITYASHEVDSVAVASLP